MTTKEPRKEQVTEIIVTFRGTPSVNVRQFYCYGDLKIEKGETVTFTDDTLPKSFPLSLNEFKEELEQIPGMEVLS